MTEAGTVCGKDKRARTRVERAGEAASQIRRGQRRVSRGGGEIRGRGSGWKTR